MAAMTNNNNVERGGGGGKSPPHTAVKQTHAVRVVRSVASTKPFKKVQVVYYLTRHGHLDHPHYMEVTLLTQHQLRLRDVMDRLSVLRGKAMPSLYSWSCKRSYKNGYVWNDLSENDIIYPTDGSEYVLKGSELIETGPEFPRSIDHHVVNSRQLIQDHRQNQHSKRIEFSRYEDVAEEYAVEDKSCYISTTTTPQSRHSRGVTIDDLNISEPKPGSELNTKATSNPPSPSTTTTSSNNKPEPGDTSARYLLEDNIVSVGSSPVPRRSSVLMQLISCGNMKKSVVEDTKPRFDSSVNRFTGEEEPNN